MTDPERKTDQMRSLFESPNLDDMTIDPAELAEVAAVFQLLANYADRKAKAMTARGAGRIQVALNFERFADDIYKQLPDWAKW